MKKSFEIKVIKSGRVDTRKYRYLYTVGCMDVKHPVNWTIKRILLSSIDTTAALNDKSDTNPNGWDIVKTGF
jgi:hypothetical protein